MKFSASSLKLALAAPLALALGACGGSDDDIEGDVIEHVAAPEGTAWTDTVSKSEDGGYILGNPDAPLKLIEYASHTCPACANFSVTGKPGLKEYVATGVVSFEQREIFLNTFDVVIAALAQCGPDTQFQVLSDEVWANLQSIQPGLYANQAELQRSDGASLDERFVIIGQASGLIDFFAARGVSADQARTCLSDGAAMEALVNQTSAVATENQVTSTPTFFLNDRRLEVLSWNDLEVVLQRAGARQE